MPVPFTAPPVLIDRAQDVANSQTPVIVLYLGETLDLPPVTPSLRAMTIKIVNEANDVTDEVTQDGADGRKLGQIRAALAKVDVLVGRDRSTSRTEARQWLSARRGTPGIADIVTAILWTNMADRFRSIEMLLQDTAPMSAALSGRVSDLPVLPKLAARARGDYGDAYCRGEIGASLKKVLNSFARLENREFAGR